MIKKLLKKTPIYPLYRAYLLHRSVISWGDQESRLHQFYSQMLDANDLCFDVGANIGNRTKIFLKLGCRVIAVEPQPSCLKILHRYYGNNKNITIEEVALGNETCQMEMNIGIESTVSSMSSEWIKNVVNSGRFSHNLWTNKKIAVPVMRIDALIEKYGKPKFIKIDVEGYELSVLQGLTYAPKYLSFEFTPEVMNNILACLARCREIGRPVFNLSIGESAEYYSEIWQDAESFTEKLKNFSGNNRIFGDIYVKYL